MPTEPTRADLAAALQALHRHGLLASVPTLDDALGSPTASALVRMHARLHAAGIATLAPHRQRPTVQAPEPPHPADQDEQRPPHLRKPAPAYRAPRAQAGLFDPKAAAAGERDD